MTGFRISFIRHACNLPAGPGRPRRETNVPRRKDSKKGTARFDPEYLFTYLVKHNGNVSKLLREEHRPKPNPKLPTFRGTWTNYIKDHGWRERLAALHAEGQRQTDQKVAQEVAAQAAGEIREFVDGLRASLRRASLVLQERPLTDKAMDLQELARLLRAVSQSTKDLHFLEGGPSERPALDGGLSLEDLAALSGDPDEFKRRYYERLRERYAGRIPSELDP